MLFRKRRKKHSEYPYQDMGVGDVVGWYAPYGPKDMWGDTTAKNHREIIKKVEKRYGREFVVHIRETSILVERIR